MHIGNIRQTAVIEGIQPLKGLKSSDQVSYYHHRPYMMHPNTNIIFILSHIAYRKDQFICPVPWTHEELILKWDRETIMKEKDTKKINQTFVTYFLYGAK